MEDSRFKLLTKIISLLGLSLIVISLILVFDRIIEANTGKVLNLLGIVTLVFSSPFWMNEEKKI